MIAADREIIRLYRAGSYRIYDREGFFVLAGGIYR